LTRAGKTLDWGEIHGKRRIYETVQDIRRIYSGALDSPAWSETLLADKRKYVR
jgi:hypothetical protein